MPGLNASMIVPPSLFTIVMAVSLVYIRFAGSEALKIRMPAQTASTAHLKR